MGEKLTYDELIHKYNSAKGKISKLEEDIDQAKRIIEMLWKNRDELDSAFNNMQDVFYRTDKEGRVVLVSPSALVMLGYDSVNELIGRNLATDFYVDPKEREIFLEELARNGSVSDYEVRLRRRDGMEITVSTNSCFYRDKKGEIVGVEGICRDITERKKAEAALLKSKKKYEELTDMLPQIIFEADGNGKLTFLNSQAFESTGYTRKDFEDGLNVLQMVVPEDRERAAANMKLVLAGEKLSGNEYTILRKDGSTFPVLAYSSHKLEQDKPVGFRGIIVDISEPKRVEQKLRLTQFSVDHSADAVFWIGPEARFLYVNEAACRSLSYSRDELLSMNVHDIDPNFPPAVWKDHWAEIIRRGTLKFESNHRAKDGRIFPVEINANYINHNGNEYNCAYARDIAARKQIEKEREGLIAKLSKTLEEVKTLSGLLPICASCKKIRDDKGYWNQIELYIQKHSEAEFSHGLCPECARKLYPNFFGSS